MKWIHLTYPTFLLDHLAKRNGGWTSHYSLSLLPLPTITPAPHCLSRYLKPIQDVFSFLHSFANVYQPTKLSPL